jgi:hypothetical protein
MACSLCIGENARLQRKSGVLSIAAKPRADVQTARRKKISLA